MADFRVENNISGFHGDEYEDDCLAEWQKLSDVSQVLTASIISNDHGDSKPRPIFTRPHGATFQNTFIIQDINGRELPT